MENFKKGARPQIHQREYYVSRILSQEALKARWKLIKYKPGQLSLEL